MFEWVAQPKDAKTASPIARRIAHVWHVVLIAGTSIGCHDDPITIDHPSAGNHDEDGDGHPDTADDCPYIFGATCPPPVVADTFNPRIFWGFEIPIASNSYGPPLEFADDNLQTVPASASSGLDSLMLLQTPDTTPIANVSHIVVTTAMTTSAQEAGIIIGNDSSHWVGCLVSTGSTPSVNVAGPTPNSNSPFSTFQPALKLSPPTTPDAFILRLEFTFTNNEMTVYCSTGELTDLDGGAMLSGSLGLTSSQLFDPTSTLLPGVFVADGAAKFQFLDVLWTNIDANASTASD